ncbi:MAG TPA: hypothetical protein VH877_00020 [Polyangia bacterium]|nr:hypothetical protein [Polyangia bacterium]
MKEAKAGCAYFAVVFAMGFVFGTVRALVGRQAPGVPEWALVLVEVPLMLTASWWVCGWLVRRFEVPAVTGVRVVMGGVALGLLLLAEQAVGIVLMRRTIEQQVSSYTSAGALIGLAAQIVFAAFPLVRARAEKRAR